MHWWSKAGWRGGGTTWRYHLWTRSWLCWGTQVVFQWQRWDGVYRWQWHLLERSHRECDPLPNWNPGLLGLWAWCFVLADLQLVPVTSVLKGWDMVHQVYQGGPIKMNRGKIFNNWCQIKVIYFTVDDRILFQSLNPLLFWESKNINRMSMCGTPLERCWSVYFINHIKRSQGSFKDNFGTKTYKLAIDQFVT